MDYNHVRTLLGNNKLKEAVDLLLEHGKGPMNIHEAQILNFQRRLSEYKKVVEIDKRTHHENLNDIEHSIKTFIDRVESKQLDEGKLDELINSLLLIDSGVPFIDRSGFRDHLKTVLNSEKPQIICIEGEERSGMSHLEYYLQHLNDELEIFNFIPLDIPEILDEPDTLGGEILAQMIAYEFGIAVDFSSDEKALFKFTQFITTLKEKVANDERVPLFFMHDFHHIKKRNDNLYDFISLLISKLRSSFPRSVFIIAGMDYKSMDKWRKIRNYVKIYRMEQAAETDTDKCLRHIYSVYKDEIIDLFQGKHDAITEEQYVEYMLDELRKDNQELKIDLLGEKLEDHLYALKNN